MELSRRELLTGAGVALTSGTIGFASGSVFSSSQGIADVEPAYPNPPETDGTDGVGSGENSDGPRLLTIQGTEITVEKHPYMGRTDAPVKMFYWNDYQCPFCQEFDTDVLPQLQSEFVSTDKVQLVLKPINLFGGASERAALATYCVYDQVGASDVFWKWHKQLYEEFDSSEGRNSGWASQEKLVEYSSDFESINSAQLESCIENEEFVFPIERNRYESEELGLDGTPFFVFYHMETGESRMLTGAQPYTRFSNAINELINNAEAQDSNTETETDSSN